MLQTKPEFQRQLEYPIYCRWLHYTSIHFPKNWLPIAFAQANSSLLSIASTIGKKCYSTKCYNFHSILSLHILFARQVPVSLYVIQPIKNRPKAVKLTNKLQVVNFSFLILSSSHTHPRWKSGSWTLQLLTLVSKDIKLSEVESYNLTNNSRTTRPFTIYYSCSTTFYHILPIRIKIGFASIGKSLLRSCAVIVLRL